ncbi:low molecular weight phosphotyrosine protein phosphatase [Marinomonas sp. A79]|uniref:protein-tyrosine-phosphatase n=1 Tax=Marinomonas vulgaris TaxID=2823372 RepID=A0ABS5HCV8_9GAMM|nr:low molecular weight protein-tyrosine-phosphatase [Marinomonas vulgaris]MBR7889307.1 low molecular weight phosphotyrosine protein phosphatase [Marinomonas vulgaris]
MFEKVLVVCVGNICRSPTGAALLRQLLPNKQIASAGIAAEKSGLVGHTADSVAMATAQQHGIDLSHHKAQQLTVGLCQQYDLLLVMEKGHLEAVTRIAPHARGKTMLFGEWIGKQDIPDPYQQSQEAFDHAYALIERAAHAWSKKL